jgi:hypothetical protein
MKCRWCGKETKNNEPFCCKSHADMYLTDILARSKDDRAYEEELRDEI